MPETADQEAALSKEATMQRLAIKREELIISGLFSCHFWIQILSLFLITSLHVTCPCPAQDGKYDHICVSSFLFTFNALSVSCALLWQLHCRLSWFWLLEMQIMGDANVGTNTLQPVTRKKRHLLFGCCFSNRCVSRISTITKRSSAVRYFSRFFKHISTILHETL